jgi:beta-N-acetylhexosaminidase
MRTLLTMALLASLSSCGVAGGLGPNAQATASATSTGTPPSPTASTPTSATTQATPATTPATATPGAPVPVRACSNSSVLATWPTALLAEQTVVVPVDENDVASVSAEVAAGAGGVILFGSSAPATLAADLQALAALAPDGVAPFVMTDEEGGSVQRMANVVGPVPSARAMGATMTPAQIRQLATGLARRMHAAGVTMDLAPVLDVDGGQGPNDRNPDGTRSFSADPKLASADGLAFLAGLQAGGIVPVVKHFPGLGGSTGNTDVMAASTPPWSTLKNLGLIPFADAAAAHAPAVMIANATVPGLTSLPASVSPAVISGLLRGQLHYRGLVITDSLSSTAVRAAGFSVPQATVAALGAGADMVLYTAASASVASLTDQSVAALVSAVDTGALDRDQLVEAVGRIMTAKGVDLCPAA